MSDWVKEIINKNITTDTNKQHMIDLIPMLDEILGKVNPRAGGINVTGWEVEGVKKIVITFLEK